VLVVQHRRGGWPPGIDGGDDWSWLKGDRGYAIWLADPAHEATRGRTGSVARTDGATKAAGLVLDGW